MTRTLRGFVAGLLTAAVMGVFLMGWLTEVRAFPGGTRGAGEVGTLRRDFRWKNDQGNLRTRTISRTEIAVSSSYGKLVQISSDPTGTNLWFVDEEGILRNVLLDPGLYEIPGLDTVWD